MNALKVKSCLIDSEITVCDGGDLPVFDLLRHGSRIKPEAALFAFYLWNSMAKTCGQCRSKFGSTAGPSRPQCRRRIAAYRTPSY